MISKRKRSAQVLQQKVMLIIAAIALIILCSSVFGGLLTSAHGSRSEEPVNYKYYKSIEIESGDTLWSIAETYMTDEYSSVGDYVEELKSINSLSSEEIHEDQYLTVAYYDTQFKK
ncbi:LysM domain-containing protein [Hespellia stercorisuis DSM 15480]|uniref:LysM domain-containing protein n=2 Tax=Hespellia stercorisuis TaxID=180311 RepID=A0A1M6N2B3_9FIRM|nr:LysM domain-containing protein [Hespellia stercorisuis DSM 15480]